MDFLMKNKTWVLVPKPQGKSIMDCKWIYNVKEGSIDNEPLRFKVRLGSQRNMV